MDFLDEVHLDQSCSGSVRVDWEELILVTHDNVRTIVEREGWRR